MSTMELASLLNAPFNSGGTTIRFKEERTFGTAPKPAVKLTAKRRSFKLVNETEYDTALLRRIIQAAVSAATKTEGKRDLSRTTITIVYTRSRGVSGWAHLGDKEGCWVGRRSRLRVRKARPGYTPTQGEFLYLAYHEVMHLWGHNHGEWRDLKTLEQQQVLWPAAAEKLVVPPKPVKVRLVGTALQQRNLDRLRASDARWATKEKRALNARRKIKRQIQRIERTLAKAALTPTLTEPVVTSLGG